MGEGRQSGGQVAGFNIQEALSEIGSGMGSRHPGDPWVVTCGSQPGWVVWVTGNEPPTTRTGTG